MRMENEQLKATLQQHQSALNEKDSEIALLKSQLQEKAIKQAQTQNVPENHQDQGISQNA